MKQLIWKTALHSYNIFWRNYSKRKESLLKKGVIGYLTNNNGYILVMVLIVSTLLISVSSNFLISAQTNINYMMKFKGEAQAEAAAYAGLNIAHIILELDEKGTKIPFLTIGNTDKSIDSYDDLWALELPEMELGEATAKIIIEDEQSKINISAVATKYVEQTTFYGILNRFFLNMGYSEEYTDAVTDWVDKNDGNRGDGAETYDYYSTLSQPYAANNRAFDSIDQLLLVRYFTPEIYYGLGGGNSVEELESTDFIESNSGRSALDIGALLNAASGEIEEENEDEIAIEDVKIFPERTRRLDNYLRAHGDSTSFKSQINKININTASYRVLKAITNSMLDSDVEYIIKNRPFSSVAKVKEYIRNDLIRKNCITTYSNLFRITVYGYKGREKITLTAIYDRANKEYRYFALE